MRSKKVMLANHIFLGMIGTPQVIMIIAVALLFFGGKKIPELMRELGGGIREFKDAMKDGEAEKKEDVNKKDILDRSEQLKKLEEKKR